YEVYVVSEDTVPKLQANPVKLKVITAPVPPVITGTVRAGNAIVIGTSVAGAKIEISKNGIMQQASFVLADGTWSIYGLNLVKEDTLSVTAQLPGSPLSAPSTVTVAESNGSTIYQTPIPSITRTVKVSDTSISGTAANGAKIMLSVNGIAQPVVNSSGTWTVNNLDLNEGDTISVTARMDGRSVSDAVTITVYPVVDSITSSSAQVSIQNNQASIAYYVVLPGFAGNPPSAEQIKAGKDAGNNLLAANRKGNVLLDGNNVVAIPILNLLPARIYCIFITYDDKTSPDKVALTTLPNQTATPVISGNVLAGNTAVSGTAPANASIVLTDNGVVQPEVNADSSGHWTVRNLTLYVGYSISVTAQLEGETVSEATTITVIVQKETKTPAPKILGSVEAGLDSSISGLAAAGADIVIIDTSTGAVLAKVQTGTDGIWTTSGLTLLKGRGIYITAQIAEQAISDGISVVVK
ncbi:MAG: DUF4249 family protein, partial [Desulfitobacteriaceae bacterium]